MEQKSKFNIGDIVRLKEMPTSIDIDFEIINIKNDKLVVEPRSRKGKTEFIVDAELCVLAPYVALKAELRELLEKYNATIKAAMTGANEKPAVYIEYDGLVLIPSSFGEITKNNI